LIIDSHTHVDEAPTFGWYDPPETIIRLLDEAGIDQAVVMTYRDAPGPEEGVLEYIAEAVERYRGRLIGYARLNPRYGDEAVQLLDRAIKDYGFKGLKLHPVSYVMHPASEATLALIRHAASFKAPTLFHCGDEEFTMPLQIAEAAAAVPEATIILGHMGGVFSCSGCDQSRQAVPQSHARDVSHALSTSNQGSSQPTWRSSVVIRK
jgi:uncharacterized protein